MKACGIIALLVLYALPLRPTASQGSVIIATSRCSTALAGNSARKMALATDGSIHVVFCDSGEVFYIYSDGAGMSWSPPINISRSSGNSAYPAIGVDSNDRKHILWQDSTISAPHGCSRYRIYYLTFADPRHISQLTATCVGESVGECQHPSVAVGEDGSTVYAAWAADMGLGIWWEVNYSIGKRIGSGPSGWYAWSYPQVPGEALGMGESSSPAVGVMNDYRVVGWLERTPTEASVCLIKHWDIWGWSSHFDLSSKAIGPYPFQQAGAPSLVIDNDLRTHIVFEEYCGSSDGSTIQGVFYVDYDRNEPPSFSSGTNLSGPHSGAHSPSISIDKSANLFVVFEKEGSIFLTARLDGKWTGVEQLSRNGAVCTSPHLPEMTADSLTVIWLEGQHPPYSIVLEKRKIMHTNVQVEWCETGISRRWANESLEIYPNPFNSVATATYALCKSEPIQIAVYDTYGRLIRTLVRGRMEPGQHRVTWEGRDDRDMQVASGIYILLFRSAHGIQARKVTLLK